MGSVILDAARSVKEFMRINPNIIFTKADKGNVTVAIERTEYVNKMEAMLSDTNTYVVVKKDPRRKIISSLHEFLARWKKHEYISGYV